MPSRLSATLTTWHSCWVFYLPAMTPCPQWAVSAPAQVFTRFGGTGFIVWCLRLHMGRNADGVKYFWHRWLCALRFVSGSRHKTALYHTSFWQGEEQKQSASAAWHSCRMALLLTITPWFQRAVHPGLNLFRQDWVYFLILEVLYQSNAGGGKIF